MKIGFKRVEISKTKEIRRYGKSVENTTNQTDPPAPKHASVHEECEGVSQAAVSGGGRDKSTVVEGGVHASFVYKVGSHTPQA